MYTIRIDPGPRTEKAFRAVRTSISDRYRATGTVLAGAFTFLLTVFSANPGYSVQMLSSGLRYWDIAFITRFSGMLMNTGYAGVFLTAVFSILVGITMTNTVIQLRMNRVDFSSLGALPGFLAGGCASCGAGVLSLLGFGGVLSSLPFQGNLLRAGGILLLGVLLVRTGDPETCSL
jgi:hypothetical protein